MCLGDELPPPHAPLDLVSGYLAELRQIGDYSNDYLHGVMKITPSYFTIIDLCT